MERESYSIGKHRCMRLNLSNHVFASFCLTAVHVPIPRAISLPKRTGLHWLGLLY